MAMRLWIYDAMLRIHDATQNFVLLYLLKGKLQWLHNRGPSTTLWLLLELYCSTYLGHFFLMTVWISNDCNQYICYELFPILSIFISWLTFSFLFLPSIFILDQMSHKPRHYYSSLTHPLIHPLTHCLFSFLLTAYSSPYSSSYSSSFLLISLLSHPLDSYFSEHINTWMIYL